MVFKYPIIYKVSAPCWVIWPWECLLLYLGLKQSNLMNLHFQESILFLEVIGPQKPYPTDKTSTGLWKTTQTTHFASDQPSCHEHGSKILDPKSRSKYGNHTTLVTQDEICGVFVKCFITSTSCRQQSKGQIQWSFSKDPLFQ